MSHGKARGTNNFKHLPTPTNIADLKTHSVSSLMFKLDFPFPILTWRLSATLPGLERTSCIVSVVIRYPILLPHYRNPDPGLDLNQNH